MLNRLIPKKGEDRLEVLALPSERRYTSLS
jgi:hypothetical protein